MIVPAFSLGPDGTSIHYGNSEGQVYATPGIVDALAEACRALGARYHVGGNGTCEALYRITSQMAEDFRERGCLCMDNGEASVVFAIAQTLGIVGSVLFQPYIELAQGWNPVLLRDERYRAACRLQAEAVLGASVRLRRQGWPRNEGTENGLEENEPWLQSDWCVRRMQTQSAGWRPPLLVRGGSN